MPRTPMPSPETRIRRARLAAGKALKRAETEFADSSHHRATRSRRAYQVKAAGLDEVVRILNGRE